MVRMRLDTVPEQQCTSTSLSGPEYCKPCTRVFLYWELLNHSVKNPCLINMSKYEFLLKMVQLSKSQPGLQLSSAGNYSAKFQLLYCHPSNHTSYSSVLSSVSFCETGSEYGASRASVPSPTSSTVFIIPSEAGSRFPELPEVTL